MVNKSKLLKAVGGGLLLLSFAVQNFVYDYWDNKSENYYNANRDFSSMSRSSLLYQNLYFNVQTGDDSLTSLLRRQYINMAAQKAALGQTVEITARNIDKQEKIDLANSLLQKANGVYDLNSFIDYISFSRTHDSYSVVDNISEVEQINIWRNSSRWIFLCLYIIASLILLLSIKFE